MCLFLSNIYWYFNFFNFFVCVVIVFIMNFFSFKFSSVVVFGTFGVIIVASGVNWFCIIFSVFVLSRFVLFFVSIIVFMMMLVNWCCLIVSVTARVVVALVSIFVLYVFGGRFVIMVLICVLMNFNGVVWMLCMFVVFWVVSVVMVVVVKVLWVRIVLMLVWTSASSFELELVMMRILLWIIWGGVEGLVWDVYEVNGELCVDGWWVSVGIASSREARRADDRDEKLFDLVVFFGVWFVVFENFLMVCWKYGFVFVVLRVEDDFVGMGIFNFDVGVVAEANVVFDVEAK